MLWHKTMTGNTFPSQDQWSDSKVCSQEHIIHKSRNYIKEVWSLLFLCQAFLCLQHFTVIPKEVQKHRGHKCSDSGMGTPPIFAPGTSHYFSPLWPMRFLLTKASLVKKCFYRKYLNVQVKKFDSSSVICISDIASTDCILHNLEI